MGLPRHFVPRNDVIRRYVRNDTKKNMKKIVITRPIPDSGIKLLQKQKDFKVVIRKTDSPIPREELLKIVRGADAILSILTDKIDEEVLKAAGPQLKIVANFAVGFDNIDVEAIKNNNVIATNTPVPEMTEAVAEHTFALMLALARRLVESDNFTRRGEFHGWGPQMLLGSSIAGKTLGIIGMGRIGSMVARHAVNGFGMKLIYTSTHRTPEIEKEFNAKHVSLAQLLSKSDFVGVHVPLLPTTRHLIGTKELNQMKPTAFLINTSRGPIICEKDLVIALQKKKIAGAGLDVFECEPHIGCDAFDTRVLSKLQNVILTPHTASATIEARQAMSLCAAKNIMAVLHGKKPINPLSIH